MVQTNMRYDLFLSTANISKGVPAKCEMFKMVSVYQISTMSDRMVETSDLERRFSTTFTSSQPSPESLGLAYAILD